MRFLNEETTTIGQPLSYDRPDRGLLLRTESVEPDEVDFLMSYLEHRGLISASHTMGRLNPTLTVEGLARVAQRRESPDAAQAFVAIWFDETMCKVCDEAIGPAVADAGYAALSIDRLPTLNRIDDEIITQIRRSRFVVADFTHETGKSVRGSVYYEAGFAQGCGLPVIYTCRDNQFGDLHFDTRQHPHIGWNESKLGEFRANLANRIESLFGKGPNG